MTRTTYLMAAIMLAGCNTPSMTFRGITPVTVTVDGSTFAVRVKDLHGEAIRTNMQYAPRTGPIGARGATAIAQVSGCKVRRVGGDQAVVTAALDCGKGPPPRSDQSYWIMSVIPVADKVPLIRYQMTSTLNVRQSNADKGLKFVKCCG